MKKVLLFISIVIGVLIAFYLIRPLFVDDIVNEELPVSLEDLALPPQEQIDALSIEEKDALEQEMREKAESMQVSVNEDMQAASGDAYPQVLSSGRFIDADDFHKGSGSVRLIQLSETETIARLENFSVTNGPDLFVYLTKHPKPRFGVDVNDGFVNLGRLKGNKGNQNYVIPDDIDLSEYHSIVIYCKAFSVLFSPASLS